MSTLNALANIIGWIILGPLLFSLGASAVFAPFYFLFGFHRSYNALPNTKEPQP